eukprot:PhM_4_TR8310/c0_g1_i2/m.77717/K01736/aroC; chorismate synthase
MSTFGRAYRVTTFGESHGGGVGCVIDGCPPRIEINMTNIQHQLDRRRPGQSYLTTPRSETDTVTFLSGVKNNNTKEVVLSLGTPISALVANKDTRPQDYENMTNNAAAGVVVPRPSHADFTYLSKYGIHASSGGGRSSARETIGRVIGGAVAEEVLRVISPNMTIVAFVSQVGPVVFQPQDNTIITRDSVDASLVRCPDEATSTRMIQVIEDMKARGDSIGGVVTCVISGDVPRGLGEPCFDKLEAMLAHAMMSIPATKGFEIGSGFRCAAMKGSEHNDPFDEDLRTTKNDSGGVQGGISNGMEIVFKTVFKPPATIGVAQETHDMNGVKTVLEAKGRHDPCVVPRAVPIVEAMAAMVMLDAILLQQR